MQMCNIFYNRQRRCYVANILQTILAYLSMDLYLQTMRILLTIVFILFSVVFSYGQQLGQVTFNNGSTLAYFSFITEQGVLVRVSAEGKILEWGTEVLADHYDFYARKLQPFMGRVEYYGTQDDSVFRGKVKSIGTCFFTYYDTFQVKTKIGKLRSIGNQYLDYFEGYEDKMLQGRLKTVGALAIDYYRSYENESCRGKLKSVGSLPVTYYSVFDDRVNAGKLKSIGSVNYLWYSLGDRTEMRGALKSRNYRQVISGVTYILN